MNGIKRSTAQDWADPDEAPDLSAPEWVERLTAVKAKPGRPQGNRVNESVTKG